MALLIDYREHGLGTHKDDRDKPLLRHGITVEVVELPFGDAMWQGSGPGDEPVLVGVERKHLEDLINCMKDRRLSGHQLPGLNESYDFVYLFVEDLFREGDGGVIEVRKPVNGRYCWVPFYGQRDRMSVSYRQVMSYLDSLSLRARCCSTDEPWRVVRTSYPSETAARYASLYEGWQKKWSSHHAHDQLFTRDVPKKGHGSRWSDLSHEHDSTYIHNRVSLTKRKTPTTVWRMAAQLDGIDRKAEVVADHFRTVRNMDLAGLDPGLRALIDRWFDGHPEAARQAWTEIGFGVDPTTGRKKPGIGDVTARAVIRAITEEQA